MTAPGALRDRQGPDQNVVRRARVKVLDPNGRRFRSVQVGRGADRLQECAEGVGFFLGGRCWRRWASAAALLAHGRWRAARCCCASLTLLPSHIGQAREKTAFARHTVELGGINRLARTDVRSSPPRDVWFVVSVPVLPRSVLGWTFAQVGGFMALWVIAYGAVQSAAPVILLW